MCGTLGIADVVRARSCKVDETERLSRATRPFEAGPSSPDVSSLSSSGVGPPLIGSVEAG
jgi:hypothetical protein